MVKSLEQKIREIAEKEIDRDILYLNEGMMFFDFPYPHFLGLELTREQRMGNFIELYEKIKSRNTPSLIYIPLQHIYYQRGIPMPSISLEARSKRKINFVSHGDYYNFFLHCIEDPTVIGSNGSDINYIVHGKIYRDFMSTKEFIRLEGIKQLGTIESSPHFSSFNQTRYEHSLLTAIITEVVLTNLGFNKQDIELGIVSGLFHDIATVPFSEQGKLAARDELDEEKLVERVIENSNEIRQLLRKYEINKDDLIATIQGRGKLKDIINSKGIDVDTISYVISDYNRIAIGFFPDDFIKKIFQPNLNLYEIYKDIRFGKDSIYLNNPDRVLRLLVLRAAAYSEVYMNPLNRAKEAFIERELHNEWGKTINIDNMLKMTDYEFQRLVEEISKKRIFSYLFNHEIETYFIESAKYKDISKYKEYVKSHEDKNIIVKINSGFNPKTSTQVMHKGKVMPINKVFPEMCSIIDDKSNELKIISVYKYYEQPPLMDSEKFYRGMDSRLIKFASHL